MERAYEHIPSIRGKHGHRHYQLRLWRAIDRDTGEVAAYWFGTREYTSLDRLAAPLDPLELGTVYTVRQLRVCRIIS